MQSGRMRRDNTYSRLRELKLSKSEGAQIAQAEDAPEAQSPQLPMANTSSAAEPARTGTPRETPDHTSVVVQLGQALRASKLQGLAKRPTGSNHRPTVSASRTPGARRAQPMLAPLPSVPLSTVLHQHPQLFDRAKVSAVERFITHLDQLPDRYLQAEVVFLSKNSLTDLGNVGQFQAVRVLSLADNLLADLETVLDALSQLPSLTVLSLEGNPCTRVPYYRSRVMARLPGLQVLDSQPVQRQESQAAQQLVEQEQGYLAVMVQNACTVHKLVRVLQQQVLHKELFATLYGDRAWLLGDRLPRSAPVNPQKLLELWDYEGSLGKQEREQLVGALRREIARKRHQGSVTPAPTAAREAAMHVQDPGADSQQRPWRDAFSSVMLCQQQTISQLLELVNDTKVDLEAEVQKRLGPHFARLAAEEELEGQQALMQDRDVALEGFVTAFQQLSPGGRIVMEPCSPRSQRTQYTVQASPQVQSQATRVLFGVTQGSPTSACTFSPERKLRIETRHRSRQARHRSPGSAMSPTLDRSPRAEQLRSSVQVGSSMRQSGSVTGSPFSTRTAAGHGGTRSTQSRPGTAGAGHMSRGGRRGMLSAEGPDRRSRSVEHNSTRHMLRSEAATKLSLRKAARQTAQHTAHHFAMPAAQIAAKRRAAVTQYLEVQELDECFDTQPHPWRIPGHSPTRRTQPPAMPWTLRAVHSMVPTPQQPQSQHTTQCHTAPNRPHTIITTQADHMPRDSVEVSMGGGIPDLAAHAPPRTVVADTTQARPPQPVGAAHQPQEQRTGTGSVATGSQQGLPEDELGVVAANTLQALAARMAQLQAAIAQPLASTALLQPHSQPAPAPSHPAALGGRPWPPEPVASSTEASAFRPVSAHRVVSALSTQAAPAVAPVPLVEGSQGSVESFGFQLQSPAPTVPHPPQPLTANTAATSQPIQPNKTNALPGQQTDRAASASSGYPAAQEPAMAAVSSHSTAVSAAGRPSQQVLGSHRVQPPVRSTPEQLGHAAAHIRVLAPQGTARPHPAAATGVAWVADVKDGAAVDTHWVPAAHSSQRSPAAPVRQGDYAWDACSPQPVPHAVPAAAMAFASGQSGASSSLQVPMLPKQPCVPLRQTHQHAMMTSLPPDPTHVYRPAPSTIHSLHTSQPHKAAQQACLPDQDDASVTACAYAVPMAAADSGIQANFTSDVPWDTLSPDQAIAKASMTVGHESRFAAPMPDPTRHKQAPVIAHASPATHPGSASTAAQPSADHYQSSNTGGDSRVASPERVLAMLSSGQVVYECTERLTPVSTYPMPHSPTHAALPHSGPSLQPPYPPGSLASKHQQSDCVASQQDETPAQPLELETAHQPLSEAASGDAGRPGLTAILTGRSQSRPSTAPTTAYPAAPPSQHMCFPGASSRVLGIGRRQQSQSTMSSPTAHTTTAHPGPQQPGLWPGAPSILAARRVHAATYPAASTHPSGMSRQGAVGPPAASAHTPAESHHQRTATDGTRYNVAASVASDPQHPYHSVVRVAGEEGSGRTAPAHSCGSLTPGTPGAPAGVSHPVLVDRLRGSVDSGLHRGGTGAGHLGLTTLLGQPMRRVSSATAMASHLSDALDPVATGGQEPEQSDILGAVLERGALREALLLEQGEQALLRQELGTQVDASLALEEALVEANCQLRDTTCALAMQTETVEELESSCRTLQEEGDIQRAAVQQLTQQVQQLEEQLQQEHDRHQEQHMEQCREHTERLAQLQQQLDSLTEDQKRSRLQQEAAVIMARREESTSAAAEEFAWRQRARRTVHEWRRAAALCRQRRAGKSSAHKLNTWWRQHAVMRRWRQWAVLQKALRSLTQRISTSRSQLAVRSAWQAWRASTAHQHHKRACAVKAEQHWAARVLRTLFSAWWRISKRHAEAAAHVVPDVWRSIAAYGDRRLVRRCMHSWLDTMRRGQPEPHRVTKAMRYHVRCALLSAWDAWNGYVSHRQCKHRAWRKATTRSSRSLRRRAWSAWCEYQAHQHRHRQLVTTADVHRAHTVLRAWLQIAQRRAHIKRQSNSMQGRRERTALRLALSAWVDHARASARLKVLETVAGQHWRHTLLRRCVWGWVLVAEEEAEERAQEQRALDLLRMVQVAVRWRRVSEGLQRWAATTQRGERMLQHRTHTQLLRTAFQGWVFCMWEGGLVRKATGAAYTEALLVTLPYKTLSRAFLRWRGWIVSRLREAKAAADRQRDEGTVQLEQVRVQLQAAQRAAAHGAEVEVALVATRHELQECRQRVEQLESQVSSLQSDVGTLNSERATLSSEVLSLRGRLDSSQCEVEALKRQTVESGHTVESVREANRELQLYMAQEAVKQEQALEELRDEVAARERELAVALNNARRLERQLQDTQALLEQQQAALQQRVVHLTAELQDREERLQALIPGLAVCGEHQGTANAGVLGHTWSQAPWSPTSSVAAHNVHTTTSLHAAKSLFQGVEGPPQPPARFNRDMQMDSDKDVGGDQRGRGLAELPEHLSITNFLAAALPQLTSNTGKTTEA